MNFFMVSKCGEGAGLLKRIQDEGNSCELLIKEKGYQSIYEGILDKSTHPKNDDTVVIFDSSGLGKEADQYRKNFYPVFGGSSFADKIECDREFGLSFMENCDIQVPETKEFCSLIEGKTFIKNNKKKKFVFKPSGKDIPKKLTYCGCDSEDLLRYLDYIERFFKKEIESFILQEFIEGALVSSEYWVGYKGFIDGSFNHTVESKKLMNDDLGPSTGCSGNLVWLGEEGSPLDYALRGVEKELIKNSFCGAFDLNAIVNDSGIYGLEWTPRFGLDAMPSLLQIAKCEIGKVISDAARATKTEMNILDAFAGGVRITIPPYPLELEDIKVVQKVDPNFGIPIRGLEPESNVYFYEVTKHEDELIHSEGSGIIAVVSDWETKAKGAFSAPYEILDEAKIRDKQYRTDLDKVLPEMYEDAMSAMKELV